MSAHVMETLVLHGFAALDLVDGTAAEGSPARPAAGDFQVTLDAAPRGLRLQRRGARLAFSLPVPSTKFLPQGREGLQLIDLSGPKGQLTLVPRAPGAVADCGEELVVQGEADDGLRAGPPRPALQLAGTVTDSSGRWLPRRFALDLERGELVTLPLWPTAAAVSAGSGGLLVARLAFGDDDGAALAPGAFALARLALKLSPSLTRNFVGLADAHGDLLLAPGRVPPLAPGLPGYDATLSVRAEPPPAQPAGGAPPPVLPEAQAARSLGDPESRLAGGKVRWRAQLDFKFVPGQRVRLATAGSPALLIQSL